MSKFDDWLEQYPRLDVAYTNAYLRVPHPLKHVRSFIQDQQAAREWRPGMFYLDHGTHPCVLIEMRDGDDLEGVSLVDGSIKMGCSIYHCGPRPATRSLALALAEHLRGDETSRYYRDRADSDTQADLRDILAEIAEGERIMKEFYGD